MPVPAFELQSATCQRCMYTWIPTTPSPAVCPECKSHRWWIGDESPYPQSDSPPVLDLPEAHCKRCGNDWHPVVEQPMTCPKCKNGKWWEKRLAEKWEEYLREHAQ